MCSPTFITYYSLLLFIMGCVFLLLRHKYRVGVQKIHKIYSTQHITLIKYECGKICDSFCDIVFILIDPIYGQI